MATLQLCSISGVREKLDQLSDNNHVVFLLGSFISAQAPSAILDVSSFKTSLVTGMKSQIRKSGDANAMNFLESLLTDDGNATEQLTHVPFETFLGNLLRANDQIVEETDYDKGKQQMESKQFNHRPCDVNVVHRADTMPRSGCSINEIAIAIEKPPQLLSRPYSLSKSRTPCPFRRRTSSRSSSRISSMFRATASTRLVYSCVRGSNVVSTYLPRSSDHGTPRCNAAEIVTTHA